MAKRRQKQSPLSIDAARRGIIAVLVLLAVVISWVAVSSYVRHARLFLVRDIVVAESLGSLVIPEAASAVGLNIFSVDLARLQEKIMARYPQIGELKVMRRLPDAIVISGVMRPAFAAAMIGERTVVLSRDGYFLGAPTKENTSLVLIKGLPRQKTAPGQPASGDLLPLALRAIEAAGRDQLLSAFHLRSLDLQDPGKIVFGFGRVEDSARFDVYVDKDNCLEKLKSVSAMLAHPEFAVNELKYIDLRFELPVIGKRKTKK